MTKKKRARPIGESLGGILVGFDQQLFRTLPPAHELVQKATPQRGLSGKDDGLEVVFPDDEPMPPADQSEELTPEP